MISIPAIELNVCRAYIEHIQEKFPSPTHESKQILLILRIFTWHLKRRHTKSAATFDQLMTLKHGVREAELFLTEILGSRHSGVAGEIADLLSAIVLELTQEIIANEALYPELKFAFDRERASYRKMLTEAREAEQLNYDESASIH